MDNLGKFQCAKGRRIESAARSQHNPIKSHKNFQFRKIYSDLRQSLSRLEGYARSSPTVSTALIRHSEVNLTHAYMQTGWSERSL